MTKFSLRIIAAPKVDLLMETMKVRLGRSDRGPSPPPFNAVGSPRQALAFSFFQPFAILPTKGVILPTTLIVVVHSPCFPFSLLPVYLSSPDCFLVQNFLESGSHQIFFSASRS